MEFCTLPQKGMEDGKVLYIIDNPFNKKGAASSKNNEAALPLLRTAVLTVN